MDKIRILTADDHAIVRTGIRKALKNTSGMELAGEAENGREALEKIRILKPDIALLDIVMPEMNGLEVLHRLRRQGTGTQCIILSIHKNDAYVYEAFAAGASGYLVKPSFSHDIIKAIRTVSEGEIYLSPRIDSKFIRSFVRNRGQQTFTLPHISQIFSL